MLELYAFDVSCLNNDSLFSSCFDQMSSFRQEKINFYRFRNDKNLSLGAGIVLDIKLKSLGLREKDMVYSFSSQGKPFFSNIKELNFSISHSGLYSIVAFSDFSVGCDIQEHIKIDEKTKQLCLSNEESFALEDDKEFMRIWTLKESYLKATGLGMSKDMKVISILKNNEFFYKTFDFIPNYTISLCYDKQLKTCENETWSVKETEAGQIKLLTVSK